MSSCGIDLHAPEPLSGSYFVATYPPFSAWDEAGARSFEARLGRPPEPRARLGLYVHVPFCVKRCEFCYYLSSDDHPELIDAYVDAVVREAERWAEQPAIAGRPADFVYFGGGTPSILSESRLRRLLEGLRDAISWRGAREVSFECAPQTVTADRLDALAELGVTRVSMGVQQLDDDILALNGRVHRVADVERAWGLLSARHFPVVNLDLIVGLVGETDDTFFSSLERIIDMGPESVTLYQLEIPLNTPLYRAMDEGALEGAPVPWPVKRDRLDRAFSRLESAGYAVRSAYAAVRDAREHGFLYQDEQYRGADLLGLGTSSFSYLDGFHHQNLADLPLYVKAVTEGTLPLWRGYALSAVEQAVREFVLQWKLGAVDRRDFVARHGIDPASLFSDALGELQEEGMVTVGEHRIELTRLGLLHADRVLPAFYLPEHSGIRYS